VFYRWKRRYEDEGLDGLKNWRILRKIHSCSSRAFELVAAVQTLIIASA
jgi:hypothetical protein